MTLLTGRAAKSLGCLVGDEVSFGGFGVGLDVFAEVFAEVVASFGEALAFGAERAFEGGEFGGGGLIGVVAVEVAGDAEQGWDLEPGEEFFETFFVDPGLAVALVDAGEPADVGVFPEGFGV